MSEFLHNKFHYITKEIIEQVELDEIINTFVDENPRYACYDTETTGLNHMKDKPFLVIFGFNKHVYCCSNDDSVLFNQFIETMLDLVNKSECLLFAHNAKYDYHMLFNNGTPIAETVKLADTMTLARLVESADDTFTTVRLESIGSKYVDDSAKFAGNLIKDRLIKLKAERKKMVCENYKLLTGKKKFTDAWELFSGRIKHITKYHEAFADYVEPNYYDVYLENRELMVDYAYDDVVIMLEFVNKITPIYSAKYSDKGTVNNEVFFRENKLIHDISQMERQGFCVDLQYLIDSHYKLEEFRNKLYTKLHELTGSDWKVGQHQKIIDYFDITYKVKIESADKKAINSLLSSGNENVKEISKLISKLRTVDKWLSTYIDGVLNKITDIDGTYKLFTTINNNGTVSGRVSSDLQQMPKFPLMDFEGNEIFHPRRYIIPSNNCSLYFADFSQVELRVQAFYTILIGEPDYNLCRAYMPYMCTSKNTWEMFDYKNPEHINRFDSGEWVNNDGTLWVPTDLHSETTKKAFPEIEEGTDAFKKARYMGKMTNFSSNYGVGTKTLAVQLEVPIEIAERLRNSYLQTFPGVIAYNRKVNSMLTLKGFVENLYGRKYYIDSSNNYYKGSNYLIQGSSADMLKAIEVEICAYLKGKTSRFIMPIHDELVFEVYEGEEYVVKEIKTIMESVKGKVPYIPIICEVEKTGTNWACKEKVEL